MDHMIFSRIYTKIIGTLLLAFMINLSLKAQDKAGAEETVRSFTKAYENITQTKDPKQVLQYVSKDLFSTIINSSVADNFGLIRSTYQDFVSYLDYLKTQENLEIQYNVDKILKSNVRGRSGVVVCDISYQFKNGNVVERKGNEATTFVLSYGKNGWKIINFNVVNMEEEVNIGQCVCEVFAASTGNYITKTTVPAGNSYKKEIDEFEINKGQGIYYISVKNTEYTWIRDGQIKRVDQDDNKEIVVGTAVDELEAVLTIVQNDLYTDHCSEFRRRR